MKEVKLVRCERRDQGVIEESLISTGNRSFISERRRAALFRYRELVMQEKKGLPIGVQ